MASGCTCGVEDLLFGGGRLAWGLAAAALRRWSGERLRACGQALRAWCGLRAVYQMTEGRHCQVHLLDDRRLELLVQVGVAQGRGYYPGGCFPDSFCSGRPGLSCRFYIESVAFLRDRSTVELFFLNARCCVHKGQIEADSQTVFRLAALILQVSTPTRLARLPFVPCRLYMKIVEALPTYGVHYFAVKDKQGLPWWLGISYKGIGQYDLQDKVKPRKLFQWKQLENLYFREKKFAVEAKIPSARSLDDIAMDLTETGTQRVSKLVALEAKSQFIMASNGSLNSSGSQDSEVSEEQKREKVLELKERERLLQEKLLGKFEELRRVCLREAELTGQVPREYPLRAGERPPQARRRVGAAFRLDHSLLPGDQDPCFARPESSFLIQQKLVEAAKKLASEPDLCKTVKKKRKQDYTDAVRKLQEIENSINEYRIRGGKKPARKHGVYLLDYLPTYFSICSFVTASDTFALAGQRSSSVPHSPRILPPRSLGIERVPFRKSPDSEQFVDARHLRQILSGHEIRWPQGGRSMPATPVLTRNAYSSGYLDLPARAEAAPGRHAMPDLARGGGLAGRTETPGPGYCAPASGAPCRGGHLYESDKEGRYSLHPPRRASAPLHGLGLHEDPAARAPHNPYATLRAPRAAPAPQRAARSAHKALVAEHLRGWYQRASGHKGQGLAPGRRGLALALAGLELPTSNNPPASASQMSSINASGNWRTQLTIGLSEYEALAHSSYASCYGNVYSLLPSPSRQYPDVGQLDGADGDPVEAGLEEDSEQRLYWHEDSKPGTLV
uniref:FERM domain containing 4B n=1 Tax=Microcebus murinus TaxID=30608 RepID=A0A8C5YBE9_MICMU